MVRDADKYSNTIEFAHGLPKLRKLVKKNLSQKGLSKDRVLAAVVKLLEETHVRVGNEEYARTNNSYGLSTLLDKHVKFSGSKILFNFRGKSGKDHSISCHNPLLAKIVRGCQDLPGQHLFQYRDSENKVKQICSQDINAYLREHTNKNFTAKNFRTWCGTNLAALELEKRGPAASEALAKKNIVETMKNTAAELRNLPSTCRKYYIHPSIIESYLDGTLCKLMRHGRKKHIAGLTKEESAVLYVLETLQNRRKVIGKFKLS